MHEDFFISCFCAPSAVSGRLIAPKSTYFSLIYHPFLTGPPWSRDSPLLARRSCHLEASRGFVPSVAFIKVCTLISTIDGELLCKFPHRTSLMRLARPQGATNRLSFLPLDEAQVILICPSWVVPKGTALGLTEPFGFIPHFIFQSHTFSSPSSCSFLPGCSGRGQLQGRPPQPKAN